MLLTTLATAPVASAKSSSRCASFNDSLDQQFGSIPATTADPLSPSLLASYAVLRRAQTSADQPPPINALADQANYALGRYNPAYLRQLTQRSGGRRLFLAPGFAPHVTIPPARCLPASLRPKRAKLVQQQLQREREPLACVLTTTPSATGNGPYGGENCLRFRDVTKYDSLTTAVSERGEQFGVLPDGIATVRVHFRHAAVVQVPVVENFYLYKVDPKRRRTLLGRLNAIFRKLDAPIPGTKAHRRKLRRQLSALAQRVLLELAPSNVELLAADGHVVKNVKRPARSAVTIGLSLHGAVSVSGKG